MLLPAHMKNLSCVLCLVLVWGVSSAWGASGLAWGAEVSHEGGNPWLPLLWKSINLSILILIAYLVARKPLGSLLRGAAQSEGESYEAIRQSATDAKANFESQQQKLASMQADLNTRTAELKQALIAEQEKISSQAKGRAKRLRQQFRQQAHQEIEQALAKWKQNLAEETIRLAKEKLSLNSAQQETLALRFITQLNQSHQNNIGKNS